MKNLSPKLLLCKVGSVIFLLLATSAAYAVCDSELNKLVSLISAKGSERELTRQRILREHEQKTQPRYSTCPANNSNACIKYWQSEIDRLLAWGRTPQGSDDSGRAAIAWNKTAEYNICLESSKIQSAALNATAANPQSAQQNNLDQTQSNQQQSQQAQQQAQQAQDAARVAQTRADQARQGKRRQHEPENEASQCIQPDFGGLYGGMKNTCNFKVWYTYCGFRPKENSWLTGMSCEKQSFGSDSVSPGRTSASHTKGVEAIHWIACKEPAWALDAEFVPGQGIKGRCYTVGGK
jgi:hypothetical protein